VGFSLEGDLPGDLAVVDVRIRLVTADRGVRGVEERRGERGNFVLNAEESDRNELLGLLAVSGVNNGAPLNPRRFPSSPIEAWSEAGRGPGALQDPLEPFSRLNSDGHTSGG
jgi:hypothetical protein